MTMKDDLAAVVSSLARTRWNDIPQGKAVPDTTDTRLTHSNTDLYPFVMIRQQWQLLSLNAHRQSVFLQ